MNLKTGKVRISKKALCVILSIIMAFGTFITFTVGYSPLHEWLDIRNMLSAYAAEFVDTDGAVAVDEKMMLADDHSINLINKDGTNTAYLFSEPISFTNENGNLKTKDITVEKANSKLKKDGYDFTNGQNDYRINFSKDKDTGIQVKYKDYSYTISPQSIIEVEGEESVAEYLNENFEVFQYKNIYGNGTNLRYYPQLNGVKDEIVLNQNINQNSFSFELNTNNCVAVLNENGTISINDAAGKELQTFETPYAYDSKYVEGNNDNHSIDCNYTLKASGENKYILTINVDKDWLNSSNTVYPVIIDPTTEHLSQNKDAGVYSKYSTTNWGSEQLCCFGRSNDYGNGRVYTHFSIPSEIANYATINSAAQWERETTGRTSNTKVAAYLVNSTWTESGITWSNKPSYDSSVKSPKKNINSASNDNSNSPYWYKFVVTDIIQAIVGKKTVNVNNYGMVFVSDDEGTSNYNWRAFAARNYSTSSYRPYTVINYTNDTTAPTIDEITKSPANWTNQNVRFTVTASDSGSGVKDYAFSTTDGNYSYGSSKTSGYYSTNRTIYFAVRDYAGNVRKTTRGTYIDKLKPNTPSATVNPSGWSQCNVSITVQSDDAAATSDYGKSGVKYYSCTKTAGTYDWKEVSTLNGSYTFTNKDNGTYYIYAKDRAGNISNVKTVTANVDPEIPVVNSVDINTNANDNSSAIHIIASDITSGINAYSIDGGQNWVTVNPSTKSLDKTVSSTINANSVDIRVKDLSGRVSNGKIVSLEKPEFYSYNGKAGILNPNLDGRTIEYRTDNDNWEDYSAPIDITETTTVYARYKANGQGQNYSSVSKEFNPLAEPEGVYTESETDLTITNNDLSFDITRDYSSDSNEWRFSTEASASLIHNGKIVKVNMPDNSNLYFVKTAENTFTDEINDYVINETSNSYSFNADGEAYTFSKSSGRLLSVSDEFNHQIEFSYDSNNELESITAVSENDEHQYSITENNEKIESITTPVGETLVYQYTVDGLIKVCYDKDTLQFTRDDDIIISEYEYLNNRVLKTNGNTVNYDGNGHYVSITTTWNETIGNEPEQTEQGQQGNEQGTVELDFSSEYPVFYEGTETVHYEKSGYTIGRTAYITENEYNTDSQLITVTETQTVNYGTANPEVIYTKVTAYTYYENSDNIHTKTVTETENSGTTTTATSYTYGNWGNVLTETNSKFENGVSVPVSSNTYIYDSLNRCIKETLSVPNENDVVTLYAYNPLDEIIYEKCGNEVTRTLYDQYNRVVQEIEPQDYNSSADEISLNADGYPEGNDCYSDSNVGNRYVYNETTRLLTQETNRLEVVTNYTYHTNSGVVATENFDIYRYEYNTDGILTDIFVANTTPAYAHYVYDTYKNNTEIHYGNGQKVYYSYDSNKNLTSQSYTNAGETTPIVQFTYSYNADNELTSKTDCVNNRRTDYNGNTVSVYDTSGNSAVLLYSYANTEEDTITNTPATAQKSYAGNTLDVTYGANTNQYKLNNDDVFSVNSTYTDEQLSSTVINNPSNQAVVSKSYDYDSNNNITGITVNNTQISYVYDDDKITEYHQGNDVVYYHYDNKNQLVREDINYSNYSRTITYTYDTRGNLTEKKEYPYTRNENPGTPLESNDLEFEYEDELWLDEIVTTPTETILYDENGNPYNLEDCTLEWTNGRQLKSVSNGNDVILSYTYDDNGIRTSKTYQGVTTYYCTENGVITSQYQLDTSGNKEKEVIFIYDNGSLVSAYYDSAMYYYITNAMGDVISIIDESGNTVVDYCYDAWGNVVDKVGNTTLTTDFADVNPMLYRSYYYDDDLAVYYLRSRYYKSDWCRFINSDLPKYARIQKDIISNLNLFVYCYNNPVAYFDSAGKLPLYLSYKMYMYSKQNMEDKKNYVVFSQNTEIGKLLGRRVKKSEKLKKIYKSLYKELKDKSGTATKSYNEFIHFKTYNILSIDGDLYLSVGHATVYFFMNKKNKKNKKNKYEYYVTVTIRDIYDFKTIEKETDESFFDKAVRYINNKYGADMQYVSLYPYTWTFVYTFKYK